MRSLFPHQQLPNDSTSLADKKGTFTLSFIRLFLWCLCLTTLMLMVEYQMGIIKRHFPNPSPMIRGLDIELLEDPGVNFLCDGLESSDSRPCLCYYDSRSVPDNYTTPQTASIQDTKLIRDLGGRCAMTVNALGRLGNLMCEYAVLYALARTNGRPAFMLNAMAKVLMMHFNVTMPILSKNLEAAKGVWTSKDLHYWMEDSYANLTDTFIRITGYPYSWTYFHHLRDDILREFAFSDHVLEFVRQKLLKLRSGRRSVTYVGVHARRSDYLRVFKTSDNRGVIADDVFFRKATNYFRSRFPDCIFVVASDDLKWCRENIDNARGDVYFVGSGNISDPILDMALLSKCNHSIITIGTFGFWAAYLAGGETVHYTNYSKPGVFYDRVVKSDKLYLPNWIPIAANRSTIL